MSSIPQRQNPTVQAALRLARVWCDRQVIDGAPALAHAVRVTAKLGEHIPDADPQLLAACLVHDAPSFAPDGLDLDVILVRELGRETRRIVRALQQVHESMGGRTVHVPTDDLPTLLAATADKIVSMGSILGRGQVAQDPAAYWATHQKFLDSVPYFNTFSALSRVLVPLRMADELRQLVELAESVARQQRSRTA